jgi:hypothetical protein
MGTALTRRYELSKFFVSALILLKKKVENQFVRYQFDVSSLLLAPGVQNNVLTLKFPKIVNTSYGILTDRFMACSGKGKTEKEK